MSLTSYTAHYIEEVERAKKDVARGYQCMERVILRSNRIDV